MSLENDQERAQKARETYSKLIKLSSEEGDRWEKLRVLVLPHIQTIRVIRNVGFMGPHTAYDQINKELEGSVNIKKIFAAELFPDESPPKLFRAWNVSDMHEDVNDLIENSCPDLTHKPRISGDVLILKDDTKCFLCDPILIKENVVLLPTKKNYFEVAEILLDQGYIPVDAEFNILPTISS